MLAKSKKYKYDKFLLGDNLVKMNKSIFVERVHRALDNIEMSFDSHERAVEFSKLFQVPLSTSRAILSGSVSPSEEMLDRLAEELEVSKDWLLGRK